MRDKRKFFIIIFIILILLLIFIFFRKNVANIFKNGNTNISQENVNDILNLKSYELISKITIKSNKNEISGILNILGICGVLSSNEFPCYENKFVDENRRSPVEYKNDFRYPVNRWRASDGINYIKFKKIFGYEL